MPAARKPPKPLRRVVRSASKVALKSAPRLRAEPAVLKELVLLQEKLRTAQEELRAQHYAARHVHERLRLSRERYMELFHHAAVGYVNLSPSGLVLELNETAAALLGTARAMLMNSPFVSWVAPEDAADFSQHLRRCRRHAGIVQTELRLLHSEGGELCVHLITAPARRRAQHERELRTTVVDVTELKKTQRALEEAHAELEKRVEERTAELRVANEKLSREMARRQELEREIIQISEREQRRFGQDLHDETCQSLGGLALSAGLLARKAEASAPEFAGPMMEFSDSLRRLIDETRAMARHMHPVVLGGGIGHALEELGRRVSAKVPCSVFYDRMDLPDEPALALYRIAQEATTNAVKHAGATEMRIELRSTRTHIILNVEDNGRGIDPDRERTGGMGLDIMGFRARILGGVCAVENMPAGGVRVTCFLPGRLKRA